MSGITAHELLAQKRFDRWPGSRELRRLQPWLQYIQTRVLDRLTLEGACRVLDVGCGQGWAVQEAGRRWRSGVAVGCDVSLNMLQAGSAAASANSHLAGGSGQALPFEDGVFDVVISTIAFHHFPEPAVSLSEMRRVLRPGGLVVIADTCRDLSIGSWAWDLLHRIFKDSHVRYYSKKELERLSRVSFEDVRFDQIVPPSRLAGKLFSRVGVVSGRKPI